MQTALRASTHAPVDVPLEFANKQVLAVGVAAVDFVAAVSSFPNPDDKIRSNSLVVAGGGNAANTLVALRRLGMPSSLVTHLGQDGNGEQIKDDLEREGVSTDRCVSTPGLTSPFTYIIVDESTATRTCIHTPIARDLDPAGVSPLWLDGVALLHCDSRNTQAAIALAKIARARLIPVVVDMEKDRDGARELLALADVILTNARYPGLFSGHDDLVTGMRAVLKHGVAHTVVSTIGEEGSVLLSRGPAPNGLWSCPDLPKDLLSFEALPSEGDEGAKHLIRCKAWPAESVVDTTGAGDSFIGGFLYGMVAGFPPARSLALAARVASSQVGKRGAREGLPRREEIPAGLLS